MGTRRTLCRFLIAAALCLAFASAGQAKRPKTDPEEVAALKRQVVELQRRATVGEVEVARLRQEVARLELELQAARRGCAGADRHETLPAEDITTGPIDLGSGVEEAELEEGEATAADAGAEMDQGSGEPAPATSGGPPPDQPPEALSLYDEGYTLFHQQRYREAEERFRRYLALYPATELADNALFWIGESHYARSDYAAALEAFSATVERYPQGNKVADALLKAGKCLEALGRVEQARQTYHEVTDRFPSAAAAVIARERLAALP
jgi:tol-pal system protein YbgF